MSEQTTQYWVALIPFIRFNKGEGLKVEHKFDPFSDLCPHSIKTSKQASTREAHELLPHPIPSLSFLAEADLHEMKLQILSLFQPLLVVLEKT